MDDEIKYVQPAWKIDDYNKLESLILGAVSQKCGLENLFLTWSYPIHRNAIPKKL